MQSPRDEFTATDLLDAKEGDLPGTARTLTPTDHFAVVTERHDAPFRRIVLLTTPTKGNGPDAVRAAVWPSDGGVMWGAFNCETAASVWISSILVHLRHSRHHADT